MTSAEAEAVRVELEAVVARLPLAPHVTPDAISGEVDRLLVRAACAFDPNRAPKPKAMGAELDRVLVQIAALAEAVAALSSPTACELRRVALEMGDLAPLRLGREVARLAAHADAARAALARGVKRDQPPLRSHNVGQAIVATYERLTGRLATYTTNTSDSSISGPAVDFVRDTLEALKIDGSEQVILRQARDRRIAAKKWRANIAAARRQGIENGQK